MSVEDTIRASFAKQSLMATLGAQIDRIAHSSVVLSAPIAPTVLQQHGFAHAGLTFALGDSAAGYAALSAMPEGSEVLTAEMKINLLAPAAGHRLVATGHIVRAGKRLTVVTATIAAEQIDGTVKDVAVMQGTMVPIHPDEA